MSKQVTVPDNWCEDCKGTGTRTLHGIAITSDEFNGPDWDQDMRDDYFSGAYDTPCEPCNGTGKATREETDEYHADRAIFYAESGMIRDY